MNCPECDEPGAYKGLRWIHCQNFFCLYYDARYTEEKEKERYELLGKQVMDRNNEEKKTERLILLPGQVKDDTP
jgi:hypothetical protein